jgi:hypothetical protein
METAAISVFSPDGKADTGLSIFFKQIGPYRIIGHILNVEVYN